MPAAVWIPIAIAAASSGAEAYSAHKQASQADDASDLQKMLMTRQGSMADIMSRLGEGQISSSKPALDAATRYYMTLATGNRGQIQSLLAPQLTGIADTYKGAQRAVEARVAPGAQRDQALADLARQRAGQQGTLPMQARSDAVGKLADLGGNAFGRGLQAFGQANSLFGGQQAGIQQLLSLQQQGNAAWNQFGRDAFNTWGPWLMEKYGKSKAQTQQPGPWAGGYQF